MHLSRCRIALREKATTESVATVHTADKKNARSKAVTLLIMALSLLAGFFLCITSGTLMMKSPFLAAIH